MKRVRIDARRLHTWPRSARAAIALQQRLVSKVRLRPPPKNPRLLAGVDATISRDARSIIAGVVLWDLADGVVVESHVAARRVTFPYVPGLLSFREIPAVLAAMRKLARRPDVVLCDAQGIAHPRRCGLATHLGLWLEIPPTIGCRNRDCAERMRNPVPSAARGPS